MDNQDEELLGTAVPIDAPGKELYDWITDRILVFMEVLVGYPLYPYQTPFARRIIQSVLYEDAAELTALFSRQSGKSETVCNTVAALMILLPRLAKIFDKDPNLRKFRNGLLVGIFAPVEGQAETLFGRLVDRLSSEQGIAVLTDPEIDDEIDAKSRKLRLKRCGSTALMMTANPRAKIESKTFHLAIIDESQDTDDYIVRKSIMPMLAATAGTTVHTGTSTTRKGNFYQVIQMNKRNALSRGGTRDHFEADWREVAKYNKAYAKTVQKEIAAGREDSDEFQMAYNLKWLLDRGMFTTDAQMERLGDKSMQDLVRTWTRTPVVVGVDPARTLDSTVVTVVWVDWDRPDEFGFYEHRVLNWLELQGMDWERQYVEICRFLEPYSIFAVAVDGQGVGDAVASRLAVMLRHKNCAVMNLKSNLGDQSQRWKHLTSLMDRGAVAWPAGARVRRLKTWKRFYQQMCDAEKRYQGPNILVEAPNEAGAHDDYVDSLALACFLTAELSTPETEVIDNPFFTRGRK